MLERLSVENYALIQRLDLELSQSLNIITGETGAGKSILLGALGLVLGNRADVSVLRDSSRNCVVEAVFSVGGDGLQPLFESLDLEYDDHTVIRRVITPAGKSRAYVNDMPVQLASLKELSVRLIDIHSQNGGGLAGSEDFRIGVIDSLAGNEALRSRYAGLYGELRRSRSELSCREEELERIRRDEEYTRYQWEQISALALKEGETEELEARERELSNAAGILGALGAVTDALGAEERGALAMLHSAVQSLRRVDGVLGSAATMADRIESAYLELKDVLADAESAAGRIDDDPAQLDAVEARLGSIYGLMKKHGVGSPAELLALEERLRAALDAVADEDDALGGMRARIVELEGEAAGTAAALTASRCKAAEEFDERVCGVLTRLGMPSARFATEVSDAGGLGPSGGDRVAFMFDANGTGRLQPLDRVASGGETSRVMLALKAVVAGSAKLPTIIFDEIDTGVSGRVADITGDIIAGLGETMQVVNITHLPQVAAKGDTHFFVYKEQGEEGVETRIKRLERQERVVEIAKMLSGSSVTPAALEQARLLLDGGQGR